MWVHLSWIVYVSRTFRGVPSPPPEYSLAVAFLVQLCVRDRTTTKKGTVMPAAPISDSQVNAIVGYVALIFYAVL